MRRLPGKNVVRGFTAVELLITMVIAAILLTIAAVSFASRVQQAKSEGASDAFVRAVASARAIAAQTGSRTVVLVNLDTGTLSDGTTNYSVTGSCGTASFAVIRWVASSTGTTAQAVTCVSQSDFYSRYGSNTTLSVNSCPDASATNTCTLTFLPTGLGTNTQTDIFDFTSGVSGNSKVQRVQILPGGKASNVSTS